MSLIDAARGVIYNHHMFIVQATGVFMVPGYIFDPWCGNLQKMAITLTATEAWENVNTDFESSQYLNFLVYVWLNFETIQ